jgi:hypothetical protein
VLVSVNVGLAWFFPLGAKRPGVRRLAIAGVLGVALWWGLFRLPSDVKTDIASYTSAGVSPAVPCELALARATLKLNIRLRLVCQ